MIAFASLFLGLIFGMQSVEMVVGEEVARVELRLDGQVVGTLSGAPWILDCDLGDELAPRHLEAIAFDSARRELGRVSQWLNLPQPRAVISVVLEPREPGEPRIARLSWESSVGAEPESVSASLDGVDLVINDPRRLELPPADDGQLHLLHVEMRFKGHYKTRVDFTFGGAYADEVSTEMTALPIWATGKSRPPKVEAAQTWFLKDDKPLRVITIEREAAEVVVIMDRPFPHFLEPGRPYKVPKALKLGDDLNLRFLSTIPEIREGVSTTFDLFPISPAYDKKQGDLYWMLTHLLKPAQDREPQLPAAVAVAGLAAYESRQRRAIVLIPSAREPGTGHALSATQARRYLEHLHVPYFVWNPEKRTAETLAKWGEVADASSLKSLVQSFEQLRQDLDRQWIVWLDGRHLPQHITLAPEAKGFTLGTAR